MEEERGRREGGRRDKGGRKEGEGERKEDTRKAEDGMCVGRIPSTLQYVVTTFGSP